MTSISCNLAIWSKKMSANDISQTLGQEPDQAAIKGRDRLPPRNVPRAHGWHLGLHSSSTLDVEELALQLLDRASSALDRINELRAVDQELEVCLSVAIAPVADGNRAPLYFGPLLLERVARMGASLDIEFFEE